ncbi:MAG: hypothetical protein QOD81_961 [Solirubrobacteraceae bacterium]|jgi:hypothetical protein|nr:hypothetical protein [Solirubrobacteraceae bacterium]
MERETEFERRQEQEAAAEAARIGGEPGKVPGYDDDPTSPGISEDPARRPVEEAGGGQAEGFEQAEAQLIDRAENPRGPSPLKDREGVSEDDRAETTYGEADDVRTSEDDPDRDENAGNW